MSASKNAASTTGPASALPAARAARISVLRTPFDFVVQPPRGVGQRLRLARGHQVLRKGAPQRRWQRLRYACQPPAPPGARQARGTSASRTARLSSQAMGTTKNTSRKPASGSTSSRRGRVMAWRPL
jgi:hypothetical protein